MTEPKWTPLSSAEDMSIMVQTDSAVSDSDPGPFLTAGIMSLMVQAEEGVVVANDEEGVVRTWDISTGHRKTRLRTPASDFQHSTAQLINSRLLLVWYADKKLYVWDVRQKGLLQMVGVTLDDNDGVEDVGISGDGFTTFCLCWKTIQAWSVLTGEVVATVRLGLYEPQRSLSVNGSRVWVHSPSSEPLGWDFGIPGSPPVQLSNSPSLHPNKTKLWDSGQSRIIDTVTGKVVFQLARKFVDFTISQWDGQHLVAGYESGKVLILDFSHIFPQ